MATQLGYSHSVVHEILRGKYKASTDAVEAKVRAIYMRGALRCPATGCEISGAQCETNQRLPFSTANPMRARLWRACRGGCQHSALTTEREGAA
ncbi:transcriptional regulator [Methylobrevis pamukkalensis]|uniref:transcriptional regulator n=1 Tax=Methylobrevis pamukkalensis TaxID=1439726 RepID=UPI001471DE6C|nr:transcriptional regulator [Methylobrevis pamukkalensis]